ncbi:MAG: C10 family peptidase [Fibrobacter sp.]|jgi:hypothetical protein|nr:C10 family peptidase [Fibrobacter sp.]
MKSALKVFAGFCLSLFGGGLISCSNDTESAVINITPIVAHDTAAVTDDSLSPEEVKMLYKMREPNHRISGAEIVKLIDNVIGILDEETGLKSGTGRKVHSITPLVSENSKAVALKSGGEPEIEIPDTLAYVVNFQDNQGFAILAADTRVESPILGFFDQGSLIDSTDNPGMVLMLERMENFILNNIIETEEQKDSLLASAQEKLSSEFDTKAPNCVNVSGCYYVYGDLRETLESVSPLIPVEWNQWDIYNDNVGGNCSGIADAPGNGKYWAGCVATSVAQIMAYWKHPAKIDNYSFDWNILNQYTANPTRAGSNMVGKLKLDDSSPVAVKNQIATLFQKIGKGVGMKYGCEGSSAKMVNAVNFLKKQGYKTTQSSLVDLPGIVSYKKDLVISSLKNKRPLLVEGCARKIKQTILGITYNTYGDKCHSWVIDGYLKKNVMYYYYLTNGTITPFYEPAVFFHSNWGWGGDENGYQVAGLFNTNLDSLASNTKSYEEGNYQHLIEIVPHIYR